MSVWTPTVGRGGSGITPYRTRRGRQFGGVRRGNRRKLIWTGLLFQRFSVAIGNVEEFALVPEALIAAFGVRPTIVRIYGEIRLEVVDTTAGEACLGAWGIRQIEADAAASSTLYSPIADDDTTDWQTWRGFSLARTQVASDGIAWLATTFDVKNPRRTEPDNDLVMIFQNSASSTSACAVEFWCRVGLLLP